MSRYHEEEALQKAYDADLMRRLLRYARPHAIALVTCMALAALLSAAQLAQPMIIKRAIDLVLVPALHASASERSRLARHLVEPLVEYGALLVATWLLTVIQARLLQGTGQRILERIRSEIFGHLTGLSLSYFDANPVGRLVTRVANDPETLNDMYTNVLVNLFRDAFGVVGLFAMLFYLDARVASVVAALFPVVCAIVLAFRRIARDNFRDMRSRLARVNAFLAERLGGMRTVQIFNRERAEQEAFEALNTRYFEAMVGHLRIFGIFRPTLDLLAAFALAMVLGIGGSKAAHGALELGTLYALTSYVRQIFQPINELAEKANLLQAAMASSERLFEVLDTAPAIADRPRAHAASVVGGVAFDGAWFAYEGDRWVLEDVSFEVRPGETLAIVGHTGAGKSSILSLLARFYDVQRGSVRLDGVDVREWDQRALRRGLGFILQDAFLFAGDLASNIRLDDAELDDAAIRHAAEAAGAARFIERLPDGYGTRVAEGGTTLSAGERQLIAFARAIAHDPAVLVLDEATSHVDSETEALVQEAMRRLCAGRTTILVAHRLATVRQADRILVLHQGRVRETGTHDELLAKGGRYAQLWSLQQAGSPT